MAAQSPLWTAFFTQDNMNILQKAIYDFVLQQTGYQIQPQNPADLQILMRDVFMKTYYDTMRDVTVQVDAMNTEVVKRAYNIILPKIHSFLYYNQNSGTIPPPAPLPVNVSTAGLKLAQNKIGVYY